MQEVGNVLNELSEPAEKMSRQNVEDPASFVLAAYSKVWEEGC